ncbi:MAG: hypothetical protein ABJN39_09195 [Sulfitobacter sp.]|uniref:hypothetical protein n=1 Tax=unclassified Sulfitobacter TaxID=196795 RepID=UPI002941F09C|nr:hypothetical protein [Sulfitobacter sp. LC.270.F.C4]WOI13549.1 hypothetical protein R1T45_01595 [Sulfitobacter sp. LC.270.F.C4]
MATIEQMAREAGFRKAGETMACNATLEDMGFDVVSTPIMPEGFIALRTERGAMILGPKGSHWVPFWPNV